MIIMEHIIRIIIAFQPFLFGVIALRIRSCFTMFGTYSVVINKTLLQQVLMNHFSPDPQYIVLIILTRTPYFFFLHMEIVHLGQQTE
jgi:hypothetical protein